MMIQLNAPWPPSANNQYMRNRQGGITLKPAVKRFREEIRLLWLQSGKPVIEGRIGLEIWAYPPDKRVRDLDNIIKQLSDSLQNAGYFANDSQIDSLHIVRRNVQKPGMLHIKMFKLDIGT